VSRGNAIRASARGKGSAEETGAGTVIMTGTGIVTVSQGMEAGSRSRP